MLTAKRKYPFQPDFAVPPGETLREVMESLRLKPGNLANRLGITVMSVNRILRGEQAISYTTANSLELVTGVPATVWNNLEAKYREQLVKIAERGELAENIGWLKQIPTAELIKRGAITDNGDKIHLFRQVLKFYGVGSVAAWNRIWSSPEVAARRSPAFETHLGAASAWIRLGELRAEQISCEPFNDDKKRFRSVLDQIRELTLESPQSFTAKITELCAASGVAFVLVEEMKGVPWNGASKWISRDKAMILLNIRGKREDKFWFSFFHEAAHILHDSKLELFINDNNPDDPRETKADQFAADILIPSEWNDRIRGAATVSELIRIAGQLGVTPGIVAGRFQHLTGKYNFHQELIKKLTWSRS